DAGEEVLARTHAGVHAGGVGAPLTKALRLDRRGRATRRVVTGVDQRQGVAGLVEAGAVGECRGSGDEAERDGGRGGKQGLLQGLSLGAGGWTDLSLLTHGGWRGECQGLGWAKSLLPLAGEGARRADEGCFCS